MALRMPKSEGEALRLLQSLGGRCAEKALVFAALPLEMKTSAMFKELRRDCEMKPVSKLKVSAYGSEKYTLVPPDMLVDDSITSKSSFVRLRNRSPDWPTYHDIPENSVALEDHKREPTPEKEFLNHDLVERTRTYGLTEEGRLKVLRLAFDELFPDLELEWLTFDRPEGWGSRYSKIFGRLNDRWNPIEDFGEHLERLAAVFGPEAITYEYSILFGDERDEVGPRLAAEFMGVPTDVLVKFDLWMGKRSPLGRILAGDLRPVPKRPWVNRPTKKKDKKLYTGKRYAKGRGQKANRLKYKKPPKREFKAPVSNPTGPMPWTKDWPRPWAPMDAEEAAEMAQGRPWLNVVGDKSWIKTFDLTAPLTIREQDALEDILKKFDEDKRAFLGVPSISTETAENRYGNPIERDTIYALIGKGYLDSAPYHRDYGGGEVVVDWTYNNLKGFDYFRVIRGQRALEEQTVAPGQKARDKGLSDLDKRRLEKLRANLAKLIGEPIVPPGFIERMRDEIRTIAMKLKE